MADRLTNVEIEDILSSIRRLVSEEARPPLVRQPPRLVLTEADRVDLPPAATADMLEARISELEALLGVPDAVFEPDEGDPFPLATPPQDTAPPVPEAAPPAAPEARAPVTAPAEDTAPADDWIDAGPQGAGADGAASIDDGTDIIDERLLRELVRDILREELQGVLGERITRNVRKLVRAEIARALSSRDL